MALSTANSRSAAVRRQGSAVGCRRLRSEEHSGGAAPLSWTRPAAATTTPGKTSSSSTGSSASPSTSGRLDEPELEDLVNLAVNGEINEPASALGEHVNDCWPELVGPSDRSLVHWLRRLVFRSAWLDQRVKEGELDVAYEVGSQTFTYVQPDRGGQPVELAPEPSWGRVAYVPR
jgi:hypothetical protein